IWLEPSEVSRPAAANGPSAVSSPARLKTSGPPGNEVLAVDANASPARKATESVSMNFMCVGSITNTSNCSAPNPVAAVASGADPGDPASTAPDTGRDLSPSELPLSLKSSKPIALPLPSRENEPTVAREFTTVESAPCNPNAYEPWRAL